MSSPPMVRRLFPTAVATTMKATRAPVPADNDVFQSTDKFDAQIPGGLPKTAHSPSRPAQGGDAGSSKRGPRASLGKKKRVCHLVLG